MWFLYQCLSCFSPAPLMIIAMLMLPTDIEKLSPIATENYYFGDNKSKASSPINLSISEFDQLAIALAVFQELLSFHQAVGNVAEAAAAWFRLGDIYQQINQFSNALSSYQQAIEHYRFVGDGIGEVKALSHLGKAYERQGWFNCALEHYDQALAKLRQHADYLDEATTLSHLAVLIEEMF
jgi:tetratricopeptide (TPR) repeat protein